MRISKSNLLVSVYALFIIYVIYIPRFGKSNVTFSLLFLILLGLICFLKDRKILLYKSIMIFILFTFSLIFPILYSANKNEGIVCMIKNIYTIFILFAGIYIGKIDKKRILLNKIVVYSLPISITNILFVVSTDLEKKFYSSKFVKYIVAPSYLAEIGTANVRDSLKAGVMYVNTNNASVFFVALLVLSIYLYFNNKSKKILLIVIINFAAEICTGCRTGWLAIAVFLVFIFGIMDKRKFLKALLWGSGLCILLIIIYNIHFEVIDNIIKRLTFSSIKNDPRTIIWRKAIENINIFGTGFGGWSKISSNLPLGLRNMPQHNHILILIYWGGIITACLYLLYWGWLIIEGIYNYKGKKQYGLVLSLVSLNVLIHGLFDNYFLQNINIMIFVFSIIGYLISINRKINI